MELKLLNLIHPQTTLAGITARTANAVIRTLAEACIAAGFAEPLFAEDVINREKVYPTGLPTQPVPSAIPHADPDHVLDSIVAVGTLAEPVEFGLMGTDGSTTVPVRIVFLLAIKETSKQVSMIQELVKLLQSSELLDQMLTAQNPHDIHSLLVDHLAAAKG